jgi:hypothetical protein
VQRSGVHCINNDNSDDATSAHLAHEEADVVAVRSARIRQRTRNVRLAGACADNDTSQ